MESQDFQGQYLGTSLRHWPGQAVNVPPILVPDLVDDENCVVRVTWDRCRLTDLPLEMCLQEVLDLELSDESALVKFTRDVGPVADPEWGLLPNWQLPPWQSRRLSVSDLSVAVGTPSYAQSRLTESIRADARTARQREAVRNADRDDADALEVFTLAEIALHLKVLRDMARLVRVLLPDGGDERAASLSFEAAVSAWENPLCPPPKHDWLAGLALELMLSPGLAPFHVRVFAASRWWSDAEIEDAAGDRSSEAAALRRAAEEAGGSEPLMRADRAGALGFSYPRTFNARPYAALCLQLANLVADGLPLRQCAAEGCPHVFLRKRDPRYTAGQHRLRGVRFCSSTCEDRQKKRDSRRRRRESQDKEGEAS